MEQVVYELIVLYFDTTRRLLYIHGSEKSSTYKELAEAVLGEGCELINGRRTFRVLARVNRLVPTNVGLKDARDYFTRFSCTPRFKSKRTARLACRFTTGSIRVADDRHVRLPVRCRSRYRPRGKGARSDGRQCRADPIRRQPQALRGRTKAAAA
ncbi:hypothetical protein [Streptomyces sp. NPDC059262]|uniref:hypothetical protein n=1 Tax=Streptomyces sp. NPDC059262 TaxID=3346797 RepID=UPI0036CD44BA